jgi:TolB-like protein/tetratricopeptide (TPR) repeat protein
MLALALGYFIYEARDPAPAPAETGPAIAAEEAAETVIEPAPEDASVAVIPFFYLISDKEQEYFSDGLADTILHMLAQIPDLRVAARTSSFKFKDKNEDVREIAAMLGVAMVLEGSVQRQGERVRITVQLIKGTDGSHIWSRVYDDTLDDIFRVQDEIATGVSDAMLGTTALAGSNSGAEPGASIRNLGGTKNVAAYDAFLRGQTALGEGTPEGVNKALVLLHLAVELDPEFARAWVELARASHANASIGSEVWQTAQKELLYAAEKALALEPRMASAQVIYAYALMANGMDPEQSRAAILKANELEPNNAEAVVALAALKATQGKHRESLLLTEKALLLNPLDTDLKIELAFRRMIVGLVEESLSGMSSIAGEQPDDLAVQTYLYRLYALAGRRFESIKLTRQILEKNPNMLSALFAATFQHLILNDVEAADRCLQRAELLAPKRAYDDRFHFCRLTGDPVCVEEFGARYLELLRNEDTRERAEIFEAEYALTMRNYERSIELLEPMIDNEFALTSERATDFDILTLATAYGLTGEIEKRDHILAIEETRIAENLANGMWPKLMAHDQVMIAAIRGDAGLTARRMALAIDYETRLSTSVIDHIKAFDTVRDDPAVQRQRERLKAREDALRERLYAEGVWSKAALGSE